MQLVSNPRSSLQLHSKNSLHLELKHAWTFFRGHNQFLKAESCPGAFDFTNKEKFSTSSIIKVQRFSRLNLTQTEDINIFTHVMLSLSFIIYFTQCSQFRLQQRNCANILDFCFQRIENFRSLDT